MSRLQSDAGVVNRCHQRLPIILYMSGGRPATSCATNARAPTPLATSAVYSERLNTGDCELPAPSISKICTCSGCRVRSAGRPPSIAATVMLMTSVASGGSAVLSESSPVMSAMDADTRDRPHLAR